MTKIKIVVVSRIVFACALVFICFNPAMASDPKIHFIEPHHGASDSPTDITIYGANFEPTAQVSLGPYIVGSVDTPGRVSNVYVSGNYAYVSDGNLQVIDISNPQSPVIVGSVDTPGGAEDVYVSGNYAYVADRVESGLQVIDISNPQSPVIVGSVDTPYARGVHVSGNYAYVADWGEGLQVIDISNPQSPVIVGSVDTPGNAKNVYVSGNYAYVAANVQGGLQVIDISNPQSPVIIGSVDTPGAAYDVYVSGNYSYVADGGDGLQVIDISNPQSPVIIGSVDTPGPAKDVYVSDNYAYVANGNLQVIDISNPQGPVIVASVVTPSDAESVYVSGNYAYVGTETKGLQVISLWFEPCIDIIFEDSGRLWATVPSGMPPAAYSLHVYKPDGERARQQTCFIVSDGLDPVATIVANGSHGPLFVTPDDTVNVMVSLDAHDMSEPYCRWSGLMKSSYNSSWSGLFDFRTSLFDLAETSLFNMPLPPGWYIFLFNVVDSNIPLKYPKWYDYVIVVVTPEGVPVGELPDVESLVQEKIKELETVE